MNSSVIIQASSRSNGNTHKVVQFFNREMSYDFIDLKDYHIAQFDYEFNNKNDDFLPLFRKIISRYDTIIFATPVYWYSMSGILKVFFDRITDSLKDDVLIKKLKNKKMGIISCNSGKYLNKEMFALPFKETAKYLGMIFIGHVNAWLEDEKIPQEVKNNLNNYQK